MRGARSWTLVCLLDGWYLVIWWSHQLCRLVGWLVFWITLSGSEPWWGWFDTSLSSHSASNAARVPLSCRVGP